MSKISFLLVFGRVSKYLFFKKYFHRVNQNPSQVKMTEQLTSKFSSYAMRHAKFVYREISSCLAPLTFSNKNQVQSFLVHLRKLAYLPSRDCYIPASKKAEKLKKKKKLVCQSLLLFLTSQAMCHCVLCCFPVLVCCCHHSNQDYKGSF